MGYGSTNAVPLIGSATPNAEEEMNNLEDITLAGFIFEPYNDGQYITKATWYRAYDLPDLINPMAMPILPAGITADPTNPYYNAAYLDMSFGAMNQVGNMEGGAFSALIDGITEDGYFADAKLFGSLAYSKTDPDAGQAMLGSMDSETGTSYWFGTYLPVTDGENNYGTVGLEFNHGSKYWRPFTYAEDTMAGSKMATRGDAWEANWTYQINEALSMQLRYVKMDYDYTGSNGFFGSTTGTAMKIDDIKAGAAAWSDMMGTLDPTDPANVGALATALEGTPYEGQAGNLAMAAAYAPNIVETAEDLRFYIRYRF